MEIEEKLLGMKRKLESLAQRRDKAKWEKEQIEKVLLDKYGIKDPKNAMKKAEEFRITAESMELEAGKALAKIETKYKDLLELA